MSKVNYLEQIFLLKDSIKQDIMDIVNVMGGEIKIPYYYDEDFIDDDIETLIEDGYDVRVGSPYDNLRVRVTCEDMYEDIERHIEVVAFQVYNDKLEIISSCSNVYSIAQINDVQILALIYETIYKLIE